MQKIINFIRRVLVRFSLLKNYHKSIVDKRNPWVLVSYIPNVFLRTDDAAFMNGHQNRREMVYMVEVLNIQGYNVYVMDCNSEDVPKEYNFKMVFGVEPGFSTACELYPNAKKLYYATGAYWEHQNSSIKQRTDAFNLKYAASFPYQRLTEYKGQLEQADRIVQIGSSFTIQTYPEPLQPNIITLHQTCQLDSKCIKAIPKSSHSSNFLWIGGGGVILKGLDLLLDYFICHSEFTLHVIGHVDQGLLDVYAGKIKDNIKFYGFLDITGDRFADLCSLCNFLLYPSCTEGGSPGAVINSMYYGVIPVVSRWAAFDTIEQGGILIDELSDKGIAVAIGMIKSLSDSEITKMSSYCRNYAKVHFNRNRFSKEFSLIIQNEMSI